MSTPESDVASPSSPAPDSALPPAEDSETVRKVYAKDLREKERLRTVFKVTKKTRLTARSGKPFLTLALGDRTGEVDARVFDKVDELEGTFVLGDYVLLDGHVIAFHGKPQVVIERLERLDPEPIDPAEFAVPVPAPSKAPEKVEAPAAVERAERPAAPATGEDGPRYVGQIRELVERVQDPHVKQLLLAFLDDADVAKGLPIAPAAKGIHHAWRGGLAEHILSVMRLANRMADHYPMADRDLLLAGALLHDIGKVSELSYDKAFGYTDEGQLVGHIVMTAQQIHVKARAIPGFPKLLEQHITHIVLAHHGELEYGSPKVPVTLEAYLVHAIDSLDSRVASWLDIMAKDSNETWTETAKLYDRHLWKGPPPTARGKSPIEGRTRRSRGESRPKRVRGPGGGGGGVAAGHDKPARSAEAREAREPKDSGPKLSFKSFELLTGSAPQAAPTPATAPEQGAPKNGEGGASA